MRATWAVVVPVKALAAAKSRLRGAVADARHEALVLAMALDTVSAALAAEGVATVRVVTGDPAVRAAMSAHGVDVVAEPAGGGLNAALTAAALARGGPDRVVALPADLPALRPAELVDALRCAAARPEPAYVPDAAGTGTVLLAAAAGVALAPRFGPGSAAAHAAAGARCLAGDWPTLRHDVDTAADLATAASLGLGARTAAVLGLALK
jgi:2-phospho-L-lactate/phosphoenolpyruvate guanylyltransferase